MSVRGKATVHVRRTSQVFVHFFEQKLGKYGRGRAGGGGATARSAKCPTGKRKRAAHSVLAACMAMACLGLAACGPSASRWHRDDETTPSSFLQVVTGHDDAWLREQVASMDREEKLGKIAHLFDYGYSSKTGLEYSGMTSDGTIYLEMRGEGTRAPDYAEQDLERDAQATWDEISDITGLTDFDLHVTMHNRDGSVVTCRVGAGQEG